VLGAEHPATSSQVISEEISGNNGYVELAFRAKKLDDKVSRAPRAGEPGRAGRAGRPDDARPHPPSSRTSSASRTPSWRSTAWMTTAASSWCTAPRWGHGQDPSRGRAGGCAGPAEPLAPQVVKNNLSPIWEPFKVSLNSLCSCEEKRKLRVRKGDGDPHSLPWGCGSCSFPTAPCGRRAGEPEVSGTVLGLGAV